MTRRPLLARFVAPAALATLVLPLSASALTTDHTADAEVSATVKFQTKPVRTWVADFRMKATCSVPGKIALIYRVEFTGAGYRAVDVGDLRSPADTNAITGHQNETLSPGEKATLYGVAQCYAVGPSGNGYYGGHMSDAAHADATATAPCKAIVGPRTKDAARIQGNNFVRLSDGDPVSTGDDLQTGGLNPDSRLELLLPDGSTLMLSSPGRLKMFPVECEATGGGGTVVLYGGTLNVRGPLTAKRLKSVHVKTKNASAALKGGPARRMQNVAASANYPGSFAVSYDPKLRTTHERTLGGVLAAVVRSNSGAAVTVPPFFCTDVVGSSAPTKPRPC